MKKALAIFMTVAFSAAVVSIFIGDKMYTMFKLIASDVISQVFPG